MFGIIGSGFGLYGHLPVIALRGGSIHLPERYKEVIAKRKELSGFLPQITWCGNEEEVLKNSDNIVISTWPMGQEMYIRKCLQLPSIHALVLEKPLAVSPRSSIALLGELKRSGKIFRINYAFLQTPWLKNLAALNEEHKIESIHITWHFMAHHYKNELDNWKRKEAEGGGAIRFFGIHCFAVLSSLGFWSVESSSSKGSSAEDKRSWKAVFSNPGNAKAEIDVNASSSECCFDLLVTYRDDHNKQQQYLLKLEEPFAETVSQDNQDPRVAGLTHLYESLKATGENEFLYKLYEDVNALWAETELKNEHTLIATV